MGNFRCERLYVMLDEPVPGLDHLNAVDPVAFACLESDDDAQSLGVVPLGVCAYAPFDRARWRPAATGLKTVRALISLYESWVLEGRNPRKLSQDRLQKDLAVLRQVEAVLDAADTHDRRFYLAMRDLG
jgi:hypothetical protein